MNNFTHDEPAHVNAYVSDVHISESIGSRVATTKLQRKIVLHHIFISDQWFFNRNEKLDIALLLTSLGFVA